MARALFGMALDEPRYMEERGEVAMGYRERGIALDLSSSGRGLQQTLLILAYMYPGAVILLDEPDAHLDANGRSATTLLHFKLQRALGRCTSPLELRSAASGSRKRGVRRVKASGGVACRASCAIPPPRSASRSAA